MSDPREENASRVAGTLLAGLPLVARPFADASASAGLSEDELLLEVRRLRDTRSFRRVGAQLVPTALGYQASLGAVAVAEDRIDEAAATLSALPNVTHVFQIEDRYPLWYVLVAQSRTRLEIAESEIAREVAAADRYRVLPDESYKTTITFDAGGAPETFDVRPDAPQPPALDRDERALVRLLQGDLPITARPFAELAHTLGECGYDVDERWALDRCAALERAGAIAGIRATPLTREEPWKIALAVWPSPQDPSEAGAITASFPEVLHCFQRRVPGGMAILSVIETPDRAGLDRTIERIRVVAELDAPRLAYPLREHVRAGLRYFTERD